VTGFGCGAGGVGETNVCAQTLWIIMPELDWRGKSGSGYPFEPPHLDVEIYRVITTIAASSVFAERIEDRQNGSNWKWYKRMELPEISRLLVSISAIARNSIDAGRGDNGSHCSEADAPVGVLIPNVDHPNRKEGLGFRDACNKVLRADPINPDVIDPEEGINVRFYSEGLSVRRIPWKQMASSRRYLRFCDSSRFYLCVDFGIWGYLCRHAHPQVIPDPDRESS